MADAAQEALDDLFAPTPSAPPRKTGGRASDEAVDELFSGIGDTAIERQSHDAFQPEVLQSNPGLDLVGSRAARMDWILRDESKFYAPYSDQALASFPTKPLDRIRVFAERMFPDEPIRRAMGRFGVKDGRVFVKYVDAQDETGRPSDWGKFIERNSAINPATGQEYKGHFVEPDSILDDPGSYLAGAPGPVLPVAGSIAGEIGGFSGGPAGVVAGGAAGGAAGDLLRQGIARGIVGETYEFDPAQTGYETAMGGAGGAASAGATAFRNRNLAYDFRDLQRPDVQQAVREVEQIAAARGIDLTPAERTDLPSLIAEEWVLTNQVSSGPILRQFKQGRERQVAGAINRELDDISGVSQSVGAETARTGAENVLETLIRRRTEATGQNFRRAYDAADAEPNRVVFGDGPIPPSIRARAEGRAPGRDAPAITMPDGSVIYHGRFRFVPQRNGEVVIETKSGRAGVTRTRRASMAQARQAADGMLQNAAGDLQPIRSVSRFLSDGSSGLKIDIGDIYDNLDRARGAAKDAARRVLTRARDALTTHRMTPDGEVGDIGVTLRDLHESKKTLDTIADEIEGDEVLRKSGVSMFVNEARDALVQRLRGASPEFDRTMTQFEGLSAPVDAARDGLVGNLARRQPGSDKGAPAALFSGTPQQITEARRLFDATGRQADWDAALRSFLENEFNAAQKAVSPNSFGGVRAEGFDFFKRVLGDENKQAQLRAAMSPQQFRSFQALSRVLEATGRVPLGGSPTMPAQEAMRSLKRRASSTAGGFVAGALKGVSKKDILFGLSERMDEVAQGRYFRRLAQTLTEPDAMQRLERLHQLTPRDVRSQAIALQFLSRALRDDKGDATGDVKLDLFSMRGTLKDDDKAQALQAARAAIKAGKDPDAVRETLRDMGIDPGEL